MSEKLKPCPFCGGKVGIDNIPDTDGTNYYMIYCKNENCNASACFGDLSEKKTSAIKAWNRRENK